MFTVIGLSWKWELNTCVDPENSNKGEGGGPDYVFVVIKRIRTHLPRGAIVALGLKGEGVRTSISNLTFAHWTDWKHDKHKT